MQSGADLATHVAQNTASNMVSNALAPTQPNTTSPSLLAPAAGSPAFFNLMNSWQGTAMLAAVAVIIGAAVGTGFGIKWLITRYKDGVEKELMDKVDLVEELRRKHLVNIPVRGKKTPITLPPIIEKTEKTVNIKGKDKTIMDLDAIHFPDSTLRQKGRRIPQQTSLGLASYKECVYNGIAALLIYYFFVTPEDRKIKNADKGNVRKEDGITRAVISYLIEILESHCLNFQGFDYDIAVLNALINFIEEYSQIPELSENRDFSFLNKVSPWLKQAVKLLEIHQGMLNLQEIISEVFSTCRDFSDHLLKFFAMLISPPEYRENMEFVIKDTIKQGKIGLHYVGTTFLGHNFSVKEIDLLDSPFKKCIMEQSEFAINVIDIKRTLSEEEIPLVKVEKPDLKRLEFLRQMDTKDLSEDQKELRRKGIKQIENQIDDYVKIFKACKNFMMTKVIVKPNEDPIFEPITAKEPESLLKRIEGIWNIPILDNEINFVQSLMGSIYNGLGMLGELCITSKENLKVLDVADAGFGNIIKTVTKITEHFDLIEKEAQYLNEKNKDNKKVSEWQFRTNIKNELDEIKTYFEAVKIRIDNYWIRNSELTEELTELAKDNLRNATKIAGKRFGVEMDEEVIVEIQEEMAAEIKPEKTVPQLKLNNLANSIFDNAIKLDSVRKETIRLAKASRNRDVSRIEWERKEFQAKEKADHKIEPEAQALKVNEKRKRHMSDGRPLKGKDVIIIAPKIIQEEKLIEVKNNEISVKEDKRKKRRSGVDKLKFWRDKDDKKEDKKERKGLELDLATNNSYALMAQGPMKNVIPKVTKPKHIISAFFNNETVTATAIKSNINPDKKIKEEKKNKEKIEKKEKKEKRRSVKLTTASTSTQAQPEAIQDSNMEATVTSENEDLMIQQEEEQPRAKSFKLVRRESSVNLFQQLIQDNSEEEYYESPEAGLARFNNDSYIRSDKLKVKLDSIEEKINNLENSDYPERQAYLKLHMALKADLEKILELLKEPERTEVRKGKIIEMLDLLESLAPLVSDFVRIKDKKTRTDHLANMIDRINEKIPIWPQTRFIDKYKPGLIFEKPVYSLFRYPTCRDKLNDIRACCDDIRTAFNLNQRLMII